ncbi:hypothetical protein ACHAWF_005431 [Thalassiosira exigua]
MTPSCPPPSSAASDDGGKDNDGERDQPYRSRKPRWWTQLAGRRGTPAQRRAIGRMTARGHCFSKDVLNEFCRANNRAAALGRRGGADRRNGSNDDCDDDDDGGAENGGDGRRGRGHDDAWKKAWWDRSLGIARDNDDGCETSSEMSSAGRLIIEVDDGRGVKAEKYAHKIREMYEHRSPLPPRRYDGIWLEIGFGNGENLLANALNHPRMMFLGCEIHQPGVGTVLRRMEEEMGPTAGDDTSNSTVATDDAGHQQHQAQQQQPQTQQCEHNDQHREEIDKGEKQPNQPPYQSQPSPYQNVRVLPADGIKLLSHLPSGYLDAILITFPDPWPKEHHAAWRVVQRGTVEEMRRVLRGGDEGEGGDGGRVYVATDDRGFDAWTREAFRRESSPGDSGSPARWEEVTPCPDRGQWLPVESRYERKGLDEGRSAMLQCWRRL